MVSGSEVEGDDEFGLSLREEESLEALVVEMVWGRRRVSFGEESGRMVGLMHKAPCIFIGLLI